jgi:hypothetical protein
MRHFTEIENIVEVEILHYGLLGYDTVYYGR